MQLKDVSHTLKISELNREFYQTFFDLPNKPCLVWTDSMFSNRRKQKLLNEKSGVYGWHCLTNNKIYIGSAKNLAIRPFSHLINKARSNAYLQNAMDLYGVNNFTLIIFEFCNGSDIVTASELQKIEDHYLNLFPNELKFNFLEKAYSSLGYKHTVDSLEKISKARKGP